MKIFIVNPFIYSRKKSIMNNRKRQPLSLAYIATLLLNDGHEVSFLDANALGLRAKRVIEKIEEFSPDILILTSTPVDRWECPNSYIDSVFEIINKTKNIKKIITGSHGSVDPEWVFEKCDIDFIVRNEPEIITLNLVRAIANRSDLNNVLGISFKHQDEIINNPNAPRIDDLDSLPFPAYHLLPMDKYHHRDDEMPSPFSIILTSRGCPFRCIFCLKVMSKDKYIVRSPENVVREIKYLIDNFGIKSIFFQDWEFTIDKERVLKICDLIMRSGLKFSWGCNARAKDLENDFISKMKDAGCKKINIGFESGSQKILDLANKQIDIKDIEKAIDICRVNDIKISMYSLLNLPGEDKSTIKETIGFFKRNGIESLVPNSVIPYMGTKLFEILKEQEGNAEFNWNSIEKYAGRVKTEMSPFHARVYYYHQRMKNKFGNYYFAHPKFIYLFIKKLLRKLI